MIIDPVAYTQLVEQVRMLKALNEVLTYENKSILEQCINQRQEKEKVKKQFTEFKKKIKCQHEQLMKSCKQQINNITRELQKKKQQETQFFEKKVNELQKGSYARMKSLQIQYKDHRLKSHLNDEFVNRILKLYGGQQKPGLPELYLWVKKLSYKKPIKEELSVIGQNQKQNYKASSKSLMKSKTKKKLLQVPK